MKRSSVRSPYRRRLPADFRQEIYRQFRRDGLTYGQLSKLWQLPKQTVRSVVIAAELAEERAMVAAEEQQEKGRGE